MLRSWRGRAATAQPLLQARSRSPLAGPGRWTPGRTPCPSRAPARPPQSRPAGRPLTPAKPAPPGPCSAAPPRHARPAQAADLPHRPAATSAPPPHPRRHGQSRQGSGSVACSGVREGRQSGPRGRSRLIWPGAPWRGRAGGRAITWAGGGGGGSDGVPGPGVERRGAQGGRVGGVQRGGAHGGRGGPGASAGLQPARRPRGGSAAGSRARWLVGRLPSAATPAEGRRRPGGGAAVALGPPLPAPLDGRAGRPAVGRGQRLATTSRALARSRGRRQPPPARPPFLLVSRRRRSAARQKAAAMEPAGLSDSPESPGMPEAEVGSPRAASGASSPVDTAGSERGPGPGRPCSAGFLPAGSSGHLEQGWIPQPTSQAPAERPPQAHFLRRPTGAWAAPSRPRGAC